MRPTNETIRLKKPMTTEQIMDAPAQDRYLEQFKKQATKMSVFLVSGIRLSGTIVEYDRFAVVLTGEFGNQLVYKHAISTIGPEVPRQSLGHGERRRDRK